MTSEVADTDAAAVESRLWAQARERLEFLYGEVARTWPGFSARPGQHQLMHAALQTFLSARAPEDDGRQGQHLALLEAGTGTGKTVAYGLAAIVASELLHKSVLISTATVALQEQLFHKDLPRLARIVPSLRFEMLKGRGRYVCESRLDAVLVGDRQHSLALEDYPDPPAGNRSPGRATRRDPTQAKRWFIDIAKQLRGGKRGAEWDGDIDTLARPPDPDDWRQIQASAQACTGGQCEHFKGCAFFKARRRAAAATIQVANHALVLATLQTDSTLVDLSGTLFVFDEAHQLPAIANEQLAQRVRLGASLALLTGVRSLVGRHGRAMPASARPDPVAFGRLVTDCSELLTRLDSRCQAAGWVSADKPLHRFAEGRIPAELIPDCEQLGALIGSISTVVASVAAALAEGDDSLSPEQRALHGRAAVEMGLQLARLDSLGRLFKAWTTHDAVPWAKWLEFAAVPPGPAGPGGAASGGFNDVSSGVSGGVSGSPHGGSTLAAHVSANFAGHPGAPALDVWLCASPMTAAPLLARSLWSQVGAAVCTSATLSACGRFDYFERLSGLNRFAGRRALVVESPFDYAIQGELRIASMGCSPRDPGFSDELCRVLPGLLQGHRHGQLVLFTSRRQMMACHAALPEALRALVQMQGELPRTELLAEHGRRIAAGRPSILFGLQSLGEGIDLPGSLCEHVLIDKIPFSPPDSPVDEALAEWLNTQGRDPFNELSVPRASMKLAQWAGRGVRTVTDRALITVCDTRLLTKRYGRDILAGLPPFPLRRLEPGT